jgi:hypothetical protein
VVWTAIALLGLGWLGTRPATPPEVGVCAHPHHLAPRQGRSEVVACDGAAAAVPVRGATRLLFGEPLDLNRASLESLEVLPGIGPARAAAIVAERELRPFGRVAELRAVRGIGPRTVSGLSGWIAVEPSGARAGAAPDG